MLFVILLLAHHVVDGTLHPRCSPHFLSDVATNNLAAFSSEACIPRRVANFYEYSGLLRKAVQEIAEFKTKTQNIQRYAIQRRKHGCDTISSDEKVRKLLQRQIIRMTDQ